MTDAFRIDSRQDEAWLELRPLNDDYLVAVVSSRGLHAEALVGTYMPIGFANFFTEMAVEWKGWAGHRGWNSLEDEIGLRATSERTGHVFLEVVLQAGSPARWRATMTLLVEAGQLEQLADRARAFESEAIRPA
jgi:Family of unknown function (DUF6228)